MKNRFLISMFAIVLLISVSLPMISTATEVNINQVKEDKWFDSDNNVIEDDQLISKLEATPNFHTKAYVCCSNQVKRVYYNEKHLYAPPTPAWCTYKRYKVVFCESCDLPLSSTLEGTYSHVHQ